MGREPTSQTAPLLGEGKQATKLIVKVSADTNTYQNMGVGTGPDLPCNNLVKPKKSSKGCVSLLVTLVCLMLQKLSCYRALGSGMCKAEVWGMHRLKRQCGNNANCENPKPSLKPSPAQQSFCAHSCCRTMRSWKWNTCWNSISEKQIAFEPYSQLSFCWIYRT